jgi:hypothetical protein
MSKLGLLLPAAMALDRRMCAQASDQTKAVSIITVWISVVRRRCRDVSRLVWFALDYREALCELDGLTEQDLRDLKIKTADFFGIAWAEARRRYRARGEQLAARLRA